jgi:sulfonate transport system permease protein
MGTPGPETARLRPWERKGWWLPLFLLAVWSAAAWFYKGPRTGFLPSPLKVLGATWERYTQGHLVVDVGVSLGQVALGFTSGSLLGLAFGLVLGGTRLGERLFGGLFHALRQVPAVAWSPLLVLWFGIGETSRVIFLLVGVFFPVALNTASGLFGVPRQYRELGVVLGLSPWQGLWRISLPSALPALKAAALQGLNMAWVGLLAMDLLAPTPYGLGTQLLQGCLAFRMDVVYSAMLLIALLGAFSQWTLRALWGLALGRYEAR